MTAVRTARQTEALLIRVRGVVQGVGFRPFVYRFFPGGDIGKLAVHGTVNDLAVRGAEPPYLTLALIAEEGRVLPAAGGGTLVAGREADRPAGPSGPGRRWTAEGAKAGRPVRGLPVRR